MCRGTLHHQGTWTLIREAFPSFDGIHAYEMSAHGALFKALRHRVRNLTYSEYWPDQPTGERINGIRNENVEALSFPDDTFDLVTSTGLFEHVENDLRGFSEVHRVLRPGGWTIFTVPYSERTTIVRAKRRDNGTIEHFHTPEYHSDPNHENGVFTWRNYGTDITRTLQSVGLSATIRWASLMGVQMPVITGQKPIE